MAGRTGRTGITLVQLLEMFPDEDTARRWFEETRWPDGRGCGKCGSVRTTLASHAKMPYWCTDCRSYFSVKTGTVMQSSKLSLRKWAIAIYLMTTNLKGVSSVKLGRDLGISQKSSWHMMHRIREAMGSADPLFRGPVEADTTYIGGIEANKHESRRSHAGGGPVNMTAVVGIKDRATNQVSALPVARTDSFTLQGFIHRRTETTARVFTDGARAYIGLRRAHERVNHSAGEYVRGDVHTNGLESFWAMLKRGYQGVYHWMSVKHLHRYVSEFEGRHNDRPLDTIVQMVAIVRRMFNRRLRFTDLVGEPQIRLNTQMRLAW